MQEIAEMFRAGGIWMYLLLLVALPAYVIALGTFVLAIPAAVSGKLRKPLVICAILTVVSAVLIIGLGYAGYQVGLSEVEAALAHASPNNRAELAQRGREFAMYPLTFATWLAPIPAVTGVLGLFVYALSANRVSE